MGPNAEGFCEFIRSLSGFQSSVRINVGPNGMQIEIASHSLAFQSSVRINVGPNHTVGMSVISDAAVSILRED